MLEKNPLIASTTDFTLFFATSIGVTIAFLIPFQIDVAVLFIPLNTELTVLDTALKTELTLFFIPSTTVEMTDLIAFHMVVTTFFMVLKIVVITDKRSEERRVGKEC